MAGQPPTRQKAKVNIAALARQYGPRAIERLALALDDEDTRIAIDAASRLLDRGYGKPLQTTADLTNKLDDIADDILDAAIATLAGASDSPGEADSGESEADGSTPSGGIPTLQ